MNIAGLFKFETAGLLFLLLFLGTMIYSVWRGRRKPGALRQMAVFESLKRAIGLAVEAGTRLHLTLGRGGISGMQAGASVVGLSLLERIARTASVSDRPPIATSGEGALAILSQDTLRASFRAMGVENQYNPGFGQLSGLGSFAYAAGTMPLIYDEHVSTTILSGHFGGEAALIADATERRGGLTLAGSDNLPGQAVLYATAQEPLIGEEVFAVGAYLNVGPFHRASLRAQDFSRWVLVLGILVAALLKFLGLL